MRRVWKSYLVFTPFFCRLLFLVLPVLLVGLQVWLRRYSVVMTAYLVLAIYLAAEVFLDHWVFGGIAAKGMGQPDYLKASGRGLQIMKTALNVGAIRPAVEMVFTLLAGVGIALLTGNRHFLKTEQVTACLTLIFAAYFFTMLGLVITRFLDGIMIRMCVVYIESMLFTGVFLLLPEHILWLLPLSAFLAAGMGWLCLRITIYRVKESYYDS